jgi:hypothetical protein
MGLQMSGFESILIAAVIVFVLTAVGSFIEFNNRFVNAAVDTVLFAIVFWALAHFGYLHLNFTNPRSAATATAPAPVATPPAAPAPATPSAQAPEPATPAAPSTQAPEPTTPAPPAPATTPQP